MRTKASISLIFFLIWVSVCTYAQHALPVTPNPSPEAKALLELMYKLSGKHMLSGQHNFPISRDRNSQFAASYIGKTPVVWSQDFGFAAAGDKDSYLARPSIVDEAIRQHHLGSIITLCWHAVPPTADEPVTFQPAPGHDPSALASVQGRLTDQQFQEILTPGTSLHMRWMAQVDEIAGYLKQLQDAGVPVLWRPYHEMNGDWFWWGGRYEGEYTTARLYRQLFDRMVHHHKLNNLIWMWSVDRPSQPGRAFVNFFPGDDYLDIVSLDVYGSDFNQQYYEDLKDLAKDKPLALGEVGVPPALDVLKTQPAWILYVIWSGMAKGTPKAQYESFVEDPFVLFREDEAYTRLVNPLRGVSGLPPLTNAQAADFSGFWVLNEYESRIERAFGSAAPHKMHIIQVEDVLAVESYSEVEWSDDQVSKQLIRGDGSDMVTRVFNAPRTQNAHWSTGKDSLIISSKITFNRGGTPNEITGMDIWRLHKMGKQLVIEQKVRSNRGETQSVLVYEKGGYN